MNYNRKTIVKLQTDNGYITKPNDTLNLLVNFYQKLFMTKGTTNTYTLTKFPGPKLSEEDKVHCEKPVTPTEAANTIKTFEKKANVREYIRYL